ncbi:MAG: FeoA domain-containing protein [Verrucomicrobiota bacterium]
MPKSNLSQLRRGQESKIDSLDGEHGLSARLMMIGLHQGSDVRVIERVPVNGPIAVEADSLRLAVRHGDAAEIQVSDSND